MKKGYRINFFLLPFLIITAFSYAGNKAGCNNYLVLAPSYHHSPNDCTANNPGHLPAVLEVNEWGLAVPLHPNGLQKIIHSNDVYFSSASYALLKASLSYVVTAFVPHKDYLYYIYPSHNFW